MICLAACLVTGINTSSRLANPTMKFNDTNLVDEGIIVLDKNTDEEISNYYTGVNGLKGDELKATLTAIIDTDIGIENSDDTWDWMKITDRDWSISSEVDPESYRFSLDDDYYFYNLYASYNGNPDRAVNRDIGQIDREHCWPKSYGFKFADDVSSAKFVPFAGTDLHHLMASDKRNNEYGHNNYPYGNTNHTASGTKEILDQDSQGTQTATGWTGLSTLAVNSAEKVYEPADIYKGDVARACLYMATRYQEQDNPDSHFPNLNLVDDASLLVTGSGDANYGELSTLLEWNELDPVDEYEAYRNDLIYNNVQENRNPYIDHPEWARIVYDTNYDGDGAVNTIEDPGTVTPVEVEQKNVTIPAADIVLPSKTTFALGSIFSSKDLSFTYTDEDGVKTVYNTDLIVDEVDTKVLGNQVVHYTTEAIYFTLYTIKVTNEGAVIGTEEGQITAEEQAQAFSNYVAELAKDGTSEEIYNQIKDEFAYMDSTSQNVYKTSDDFTASVETYSEIEKEYATPWNTTIVPFYETQFFYYILIGLAVVIIAVSTGVKVKKGKGRKRK